MYLPHKETGFIEVIVDKDFRNPLNESNRECRNVDKLFVKMINMDSRNLVKWVIPCISITYVEFSYVL